MAKKYLLFLTMVSFLVLCAGAAFAAMGTVDSFSFLDQTADVVGTGRSIGADQKTDAVFSVTIRGTAGAISGFSLKNLTTGQEWSTGGSGNILGVANNKGEIVNGSFPKVAFVMGAQFTLYVNDRDALLQKGGNFQATVTFVDGSSSSAGTTVKAVAAATTTTTQAASQTAGNAEIVSADYKGVGKYDFSDGTKKLSSNMNPDHYFNVRLRGNDTLTGVRIRTQDNSKVWDTVPSTQNALIVLTDMGKGTVLNKSDGSVSLEIKTARDLSLWVEEGKDMGKQDFRLTFLFAGGRIEELDVKAKQTAATKVAETDTKKRTRGDRERTVQMTAKPVQIKLDVVGKNKLKKASGVRDFSMMIRVRGSGKIEAIALANQTGDGKWDTISDSKAWLMLVRKSNTQMNNAKDLSVSIPVDGNVVLELLMEDNGTFTKKNARYLLTVTWDDGEITEQLLTW